MVGVVMVGMVMVEVMEEGMVGKSGRPFRERTTAVKLWQEHLAWVLHRASAEVVVVEVGLYTLNL